jgi:tetratricopeptide (TPR) repeat protein
LEFTRPAKAYELLEESLPEFDNYIGGPDVFHNVGMVAQRVDHYPAARASFDRGLTLWPDSPDLLCDLLQACYGQELFDPVEAARTWERLNALGVDKIGRYWRYWVYGANYHVQVLGDTAGAVGLLDQGLLYVDRGNLYNVLDAYDLVLSTGPPYRLLTSEDDLHQYQEEVQERVAGRLQLGLDLGVRNGYVLAVSLATLRQEQVAASGASHTTESELTEVVKLLDVAEALYTANSNHPVSDIYLVKARVLMAQGRYGDALNLIRSVSERGRDEQSIAILYRLAALRTGVQVDDESTGDESTEVADVLGRLFADGGQLLLALARDNPDVAAIIVNCAQEILRLESES